MAKLRLLYPYPVVIAYFQAGETVRMSFGQPVGKPWRFQNVTNMVQQVIGNERERNSISAWWLKPQYRYTPPIGKPATDLLSIHIEHNGSIIRDLPAISRNEKRKQVRLEKERSKSPARKRVSIFTNTKTTRRTNKAA